MQGLNFEFLQFHLFKIFEGPDTMDKEKDWKSQPVLLEKGVLQNIYKKKLSRSLHGPCEPIDSDYLTRAFSKPIFLW